MTDSIVPITLINALMASSVDKDNKWIESDMVAISIGDLREAIEKAKDLGYKESDDEKSYGCDCDDERYDEGFDDGYDKAIREQREKEGKTNG